MTTQDTVISRTRAVDVFAPHANIEKTNDTKENISHFILQYVVDVIL